MGRSGIWAYTYIVMSPVAIELVDSRQASFDCFVAFLCAGVLTDHTKPIRPFQKRDHVIRPHIEELLMLMPHFRVGVYSSATLKTVNTAIDKIVRGLRRQRPGVL